MNPQDKPVEVMEPEKAAEDVLGRLMTRAEELNVPYLELSTIEIERDAARLIPASTSEKVKGVVVGRKARNLLTLVTSDPKNVYIHDHVDFVTDGKCRAHLLLGDPRQIELARKFIYSDDVEAQTLPWSVWLRRHRLGVEAVEVRGVGETVEDADLEIAKSQHIIEAVNDIIRQGVALDASDIHLEHMEDRLVVRYRIDGVLERSALIVQRAKARPYVQRLKIMSNMDIANDRLPQGGRISLNIGDVSLDLRVSTVPSKFGENVVMRILNRKGSLLSLTDLGLGDRELRLFGRMVALPHGFFLVSGPTGSGKSTTLYSALGVLNTSERKILTVEDPVESVILGVTQVQVNMQPREEERRLTFARALREFLRQDPDVIMIGEIRDEESAAIATEAALTGHLVFSTVHTNDAVGVITRLKEMNVPLYVVANTLIGAMAQRLVRKVCSYCRTEVEGEPEAVEILERLQIQRPYTFVASEGCESCRKTGFLGRIGIFEMLPVSRDLRVLIEQDAPAVHIEKAAEAAGMTSLYYDGMCKVARGITTFHEVSRVTAQL